MSSDINTAAELANNGRQITLDNGNVITLRYNFGAISVLEKEYGSIDAFTKALNAAAGNEEDGTVGQGPLITILGHAIWAGSQRKIRLEDFLDLLDSRRTREYSTAFGEAFGEAVGASNSGEDQAAENVA